MHVRSGWLLAALLVLAAIVALVAAVAAGPLGLASRVLGGAL